MKMVQEILESIRLNLVRYCSNESLQNHMLENSQRIDKLCMVFGKGQIANGSPIVVGKKWGMCWESFMIIH